MFTQRITRIAIAGATTLTLGLGVALPASQATEINAPTSGVLLVEDTTPVSPTTVPLTTASVTQVIGIDANIVDGLSITAPKGSTITLAHKGTKTQSKKIVGAQPAAFTKLTPGKKYAVTVNGKTVGTGTPVNAPGEAFNLAIRSTGSATSALATWKYQEKAKSGVIKYELNATPVSGQLTDARSGALTRTVTTTTRQAVIGNLDPDIFYTFTVTPKNTAASGKASSVTLPVTLGTAAGQLSATEKAQAVETARAAAQLAAEAAARAAANNRPAVTPAATPTGPAAPTTKTIYVCPSGFTEVSSSCTKTLPYTFTYTPYTYRTEVTNRAYTYHTVTTGPMPILDSFETANVCPGGYNLEDYGVNGKWCRLYGPAPTAQVKDAAPAGFTDNGSNYTKSEQIKNNPPTGYTDNGTQWVTTNPAPAGYTDNGSTWITVAAKEAKVVPA